jgi:hypothetical protein
LAAREAFICGGRKATVVHMAEVILKNIKKIYPNIEGEKKKRVGYADKLASVEASLAKYKK